MADQDIRTQTLNDAAHTNNKYAPFAPIDPSTTKQPDLSTTDDPFRGNENNRRAHQRKQDGADGASVQKADLAHERVFTPAPNIPDVQALPTVPNTGAAPGQPQNAQNAENAPAFVPNPFQGAAASPGAQTQQQANPDAAAGASTTQS